MFIRSCGSLDAAKARSSTPTGEDNSGRRRALSEPSVALSSDGNTALIGAQEDGSDEQGAAWVFTCWGGAWSQQGPKLTPSDEDNTGGGGEFGFAAALSGDGNSAPIRVLYDGADATGAVWAFKRSSGTWSQQGSKITPSDENVSGGEGWFGFAVALSTDRSSAAISWCSGRQLVRRRRLALQLVPEQLEPARVEALPKRRRQQRRWSRSRLRGRRLVGREHRADWSAQRRSVLRRSCPGLSSSGHCPGRPKEGQRCWRERPGGGELSAPPVSNGGATISSYTVTASPGGAHASGSASPIRRSRG